MKILLIGPFPPPINGCSFANQVLLNNLRSNTDLQGYYIDTSTSEISSNQGDSFSLKKAYSFFKVYLKIGKVFSAERVYLTPGHTFYGVLKYLPFILTCILLGKKYFLHIHGNNLGKEYSRVSSFKKKILYYLLSNAEGGIVLSNSLVGNLDPFLNDKKIFIVENFVEDGLINEGVEVDKPDDKLRVLYLSNLMKEKGVLDLLDALKILETQNIDFEVVFAGNIEEDIREVFYEKLEGLSNGKYVGVVRGEEKKRLFLEANVFVLPTYYKMEGQPISLLEAMATGNIVVTTEHSGIIDICTTSNGFFVEKNSPKSIATTLLHIRDNLHLVTEIAKHNIHYCKSNFTEQKFASKILDIMK